MRPFLSFFILALTTILLTSGGKKSEKIRIKLPKPYDKQFVAFPSLSDSSSENRLAFFVSKYETSNLYYREFLDSFDNHAQSRDVVAIDSTLWNKTGAKAYFDPMAKHYHSHPAYDNYPVVNVSKEGAELYCLWLSKLMNKENSPLEIIVRLPTREEWLAICSESANGAPYSWGNPKLTCTKGAKRCNYRVFGDEAIETNETGERIVRSDVRTQMMPDVWILAPSNSYSPNDRGIFNLNGNVAEMTADNKVVGGGWLSTGYDVRNTSYWEYNGPNVDIGFRPVIEFRLKK